MSLIAILDADKEGFLRSETSLIQTIGRAARNAGGRVILYADKITEAMRSAMDETARRRQIQQKYNEEHGIVPKTIVKSVRDLDEISTPEHKGKGGVKMTKAELDREIAKLEVHEEGRADDGIRVCRRAARRDHPTARREAEKIAKGAAKGRSFFRRTGG